MEILTPVFAASWARACKALAVSGHEALRDELLARYAEPHRKYHTLQHLQECLVTLSDAAQKQQYPGEVEMALWFHDAIYDTARHDNEALSAQWATEALTQAGVEASAVQRIHALVMATRHSVAPQTADEKLLVDVDLAILGATPVRFDEYEQQVRDEYAFVPEDVFRSRRKDILAGFLTRPALYATTGFHARLEAAARANLARSLAQLSRCG